MRAAAWICGALLLGVLACSEARERPESEALRFHAEGINTPEAEGYHGAVLREQNYDFGLCESCHSEAAPARLREGATLCTECHEAGARDCTTCHGGAALSGAHPVHVDGGALARPAGCESCHPVPEHWDDPGHLFDAAGALDPPPAELTVSWDAARGTCGDVACHGGATPPWDAAGPLGCGDCHAFPPPDHAIDACELCHQRVAGGGQTLIDLSLHIDGEVQVGRGEGGCGDCHGRGSDGLPSDRLHAAHLSPPRALSLPVDCSACHRVPGQLSAPGHIDDALPAELRFSGLAVARGAEPRWSPQTRSCSGGYCHAGDTAEVAELQWREEMAGDQVYCGSCHGIPPASEGHAPTLTREDCGDCHGDAIDAAGVVDPARHIDGRVDFGAF